MAVLGCCLGLNANFWNNMLKEKNNIQNWMHDFAQEDSKNPYTFHVVYQMQSTLDILQVATFYRCNFVEKKEAAEHANPPIQNLCRVLGKTCIGLDWDFYGTVYEYYLL